VVGKRNPNKRFTVQRAALSDGTRTWVVIDTGGSHNKIARGTKGAGGEDDGYRSESRAKSVAADLNARHEGRR
jgi:hypothetical protein